VGKLATDVTGLDLNSLAEELAAGLRPKGDVWRSYGIVTAEDARALLELPVFDAMVREAHARWNGRSNVRERIKSKTLIGIEQYLPEMFDEANNVVRPLHHRVQMWKWLGALAGLDAEAAAAGGGGGGGGVQITIDLSGGTPRVSGNQGEDGGIIVIGGGTGEKNAPASGGECSGEETSSQTPDDAALFSINVQEEMLAEDEIEALGAGIEPLYDEDAPEEAFE
jgi:hypothetical protein